MGIGKSLIEVFPGVETFGLLEVLRRVWTTGTAERLPVRYYHDKRLSRWYDNYVYRLPTGEVVAAFDDVTALKNHEQQLKCLAYSDALTALPNRVRLLNRLLAAAAAPLRLGEVVVQVSASLGVTFYPQPVPGERDGTDALDADQLLRQADQAMYRAKRTGKNRYHVFDVEKDHRTRGQHESLERLGHALLSREFVLYYQPKVDLRTGAVIGAEAIGFAGDLGVKDREGALKSLATRSALLSDPSHWTYQGKPLAA